MKILSSLHWRPWKEERGWQPFLWLLYLGFLGIPLTFGYRSARWVAPTLLTIPVFLVLYFRLHRLRWRSSTAELAAVAALAYVLAPFNPAAFTYLTYAAAFTPYRFTGIVRALAVTCAFLIAYAAEVLILSKHEPFLSIFLAAIVCTAACVGNSLVIESDRRNAALRVSQEEVRGLAALAERERIGRDLHDLLGHTLSLIVIKAELAKKLIDRDRESTHRELTDMMNVAREALAQVRTAVGGMRRATLDVEMASARALLAASGVGVVHWRDEVVLPQVVEVALAMIVREAATNICRHAAASRAWFELRREGATDADEELVTLLIRDDGRGGAVERGHGLWGIKERVSSLGGTMEFTSPRGRGTTLCIRLKVDVRSFGKRSLVSAAADGSLTKRALPAEQPVPPEAEARGTARMV